MRLPMNRPARIVMACSAILAGTASVASAQTFTYGPIIGRGATPDKMIVKWGTGVAGDTTAVSFRKKGAATFQTVTGSASRDHEVVLTGLTEGTAYEYYAASGATQSTTNGFSTCP